jgi:deazaflavin-dependent oxidoreductase (nitroreductase family)
MDQRLSSARKQPPPTVPFMRFLIGRYRWGRWFENRSIKVVGISPISAQVAFFRRTPYPPTLMLTTIGRKTGELREAPLPYHRIGDELVVIGSLAGGPRNPNWVANIRSDPRCWVHVKRRFRAATARIVTGEERQAFLERCINDRPIVKSYDDGARSHGREMPIVAIRPNVARVARAVDDSTEGR